MEVTSRDGSAHTATITALDTGRDLAVLEVPGLSAPPVEFGRSESGDEVTIVGAATSGSVGAEVLRPVTLSIDQVRGTDRTSRRGYELRADISRGDSGAGVFDSDGRLTAVVFGTPTDGDGTAWATGSEEVAGVLEAAASGRRYECDSAESRVVPAHDAD